MEKEVSSGVKLVSLSKRYRDTVAVDSIDLEVFDGELFTILGGSGSGKSTTLLMIAGFTPASSGQVFVGSQLMNDIPPQKRNVGMIFQHYANFPHLSLHENVAFPLRARGMASSYVTERVSEMLKLVQLDGMGERLPHQLSGGQQQRAAIARALAFRPRVLLMDEPLGALDKKLREYMQREIRALQQQLRLTTIYITHDQDEALSLSDRVAIMRDGRIEQVGTPQQLYESPRTIYVAEFLGDSNIFDGVAETALGDGVWRVRLADGTAIQGIGAVSAGGKVKVMVRPEHVHLSDETNVDSNSCAGRVEDIKYLGDMSFAYVRLGSGTLVKCKDLTQRLAGNSTGQAIHAVWSAKYTQLFAAGQ